MAINPPQMSSYKTTCSITRNPSAMAESIPKTTSTSSTGDTVPGKILTFYLDKAAELGISLTHEKLTTWLARPFFDSLLEYKFAGSESPFKDMWDEWCYLQVVYWQVKLACYYSTNKVSTDTRSSSINASSRETREPRAGTLYVCVYIYIYIYNRRQVPRYDRIISCR
ncbi:hypothetical protein BJX76DRAFT_301012 [Aspergillus varians]